MDITKILDISKILGSKLTPNAVKKRAIDAYGVENILDDYDKITRDIYYYVKSDYVMNLLLKLSREKTENYFRNFNINDEEKDCSKLESLLRTKKDSVEYENLIKLLSKDTSLRCIFAGFLRVSSDLRKDIWNIKLDELGPEFDKSIDDGSYKKYLNNDTPEYIIEYICSKLEIDEIMNVLTNDIGLTTKDYISKYCAPKYQKFIVEEINKDPHNIDIYKDLCNTYEARNYLVENIDITEGLLEYLYVDRMFSYIKNEVMYKRHDEIEKIVKNMFPSNPEEEMYDVDFEKYLISPQDTDLLNMFAKYLPWSYVEEVIKKPHEYHHSSVFNAIYEVRKEEIASWVIKDFNNDPNTLAEHFKDYLSRDIIKIIMDNIDFTEEMIDSCVDEDDHTINSSFYAYKHDLFMKVINKRRNNSPDYLARFIRFNFIDGFVKGIKDTITEEELKYIYYDRVISADKINEVYLNTKELSMKIVDEARNAGPKKLFSLIKSIEKTNFRNDIMNILTFEEKMSIYKVLSFDERNLIANDPKIFRVLKTEKDENFLNFYYKFIEMDYSNVRSLAVEMLTDEDLINLIKDGNKTFKAEITDDINELARNAIINSSEKIKNSSEEELVKFLKGLRYRLNDLYEVFLDNIELDERFINYLITERGLSDEQKVILYLKKKNELTEIVSNILSKDPDKRIDYIQKGMPKPILDIALSYYTRNELLELLGDSNFVDRRSVGKKFASELCLSLYEDTTKRNKVKDLRSNYKGDTYKLIYNFEKVDRLIEELGIKSSSFWQYSLNSSYDFLDDLTTIANGKTSYFKDVYEYFNNNIFNSKNNYSYDDFLLLVKNYIRYEDLCNNLIETNLTEEQVKNILVLFKESNTLEEKPEEIEDVENIMDLIRNNYRSDAENCNVIDDYKRLIFQMLFNKTKEEMVAMLYTYGSTLELKELKFYNKDNPEVIKKINEIEKDTSLIEDICDCSNLEDIRNLTNNLISRIDTILRDSSSREYEVKMRELYAMELSSNLTKIETEREKNLVFDEELTNKYGVETYNFSDKKYLLLAHVISMRETVDTLLNGISSGDANFISMSAISNRNQGYYWNGSDTIYGYDYIPEENYICSSSNNMGSNGILMKNSTEIPSFARNQRGISEVSDTDGNSEILLLRNGLKPSYIILPEGTEPSEEEIETAKRYSLKFVRTQRKNTNIKDPIEIKDKKNKKYKFTKSELVNLRTELSAALKNNTSFAVITDSHGLLEPTLAVLEDIRQKGISEIYSLGDNIGTGPNPGEVIDVLDAYGVKSVKGNHEHYLLDGVDKYKEHLDKTDAYEIETESTKWTKDNLSDDEIDSIKKYDESIVLQKDGKKILLTHTLKDYNDLHDLFNTDDYDLVLIGHEHFRRQDGNVYTLKAVGIGNSNKKDVGNATYSIVSLVDGKFVVNEINIPYSLKNTINSISTSTANEREKIARWASR